jgi:hypothetical protein
MKKTSFMKAALVGAMMVSVMVTSCGGTKQVAQAPQQSSAKSADDIDQQIALRKKQMELDAVEAEAKLAKTEQDRKLKQADDDAKAAEQKKRKMAKGEQFILIPCMQSGYDSPGEYMAGLGVVEDRPDRNRAIVDANRAAVVDMATRYIGVLKNGIEDYSKDVNVPAGKKMYESSLDGGAGAIGKKVIDKYANVVCREVAQNEVGGWIGYVAVHVMLADLKKGLADELEVRKVDYDKKKFFEKMDAELAADEAKHQKDLEKMGEELVGN